MGSVGDVKSASWPESGAVASQMMVSLRPDWLSDGFQVQGLKAHLSVCSKLFLWRDWKYLTFLLMWLWISFFVQLRTIKTSCVLFSHMKVRGGLSRSCTLSTLTPYIHLKRKKLHTAFLRNFRMKQESLQSWGDHPHPCCRTKMNWLKKRIRDP